MNRRATGFVILLALCLGAMGRPVEAGVIDVRNQNLTAGSWGPTSGQSYGQTFTAPAGDTLLVDYSFTVGASRQFRFVSQVYRWGGLNATGPALFTSPIVLTPLPLFSSATYVFSPAIPVSAGQQYIAFVTNQPDGVSLGGPLEAGGTIALNQNNLYEGGQFVFNTSGNPANGTWFLTLPNVDAVFHATFIPEPATLLLLSLGLSVLAGAHSWARRADRSKIHLTRHVRGHHGTGG